MKKNNGKKKRVRETPEQEVQEKKVDQGWDYYHSLIETSSDFFFTLGPDGIIIDINSAAEKATGLPREKIIGTGFSEYFTDPEKAHIGYVHVIAIGKIVDYELCLKHINGAFIRVSCNASVYSDKMDQTLGVLVVARDISASKKYEDELINSGNNLELRIQEKTAELIIANNELAFQNEEKDKRAAELIIANTELVFQNAEKDKRAAELVLANDELVFQTREKADRAAELVLANKELAFQNEEKDKRSAELVIANSELVLQNEEILYISHHDFLTGLYNRIHFEHEKKRLDISSQLPISIIMGDVNGLKLINDGFGHSQGDELLINISKILKSCCRDEDVISRIGGDEFGIILPQTDSKSAQQICGRISDACNGYVLQGSQIYLSISLGYATKEISTEKIDSIIMTAEENMSMHKLLERKSVHSSIIASIKAIMFEKSHETEEHAERMAFQSKSIGLAMSLTEAQMNELELVSTLHDIGKMGVSAEILSKPGKLSDKEWVEMKKHPEIGFRIAQATYELIPIAEFILSHHERWDGKGYPQGLIGEDIPLLSRIVAVVDAFDAMTNDRAYRLAMTKEEAIDEIRRGAGTQFDPEVSRVFVEKVLGQGWDQVNIL